MTTPDQNQQGNRPTDPMDPRYYAARGVTNELEQQMRADAVRQYRLLEEARNVGSLEEFDKFSGQAEEIEDRWRTHDSATAQADWAYLNDARHDWSRAPGTMERLYEQVIIDRVDGVTEGMTPAEWRSQRQAREMAGHGDWPEMRGPYSAEARRSRPTSAADPTSPNHYTDAADWAEQVMRADFARVYQLDKERNQTDTDREYVQLTEQMHEISEPWITRNDRLAETWRDMRWLSSGSYGSRGEYGDAVERMEQYRRDDDPLFTRSVNQVGELTGIVPRRQSTTTQRSTEPPVSSAFAAARTAELARGNAFSGLSANAFASGPERKGLAR
ncbi:hypothetical protein [Nocardia carnea]|uniref:hypothetical protein n=1 Tax=Nocardia carnea TaxID=37328 RepID=UPI0024556687|nr:hypothetical protein [Nocardia carnea]